MVMLDCTSRSGNGHNDGTNISLTLTGAGGVGSNGMVSILAARLIAYEQQMGFTRLKLTDGSVLDVKETTDQIDRLVRNAASAVAPARKANGVASFS